MAYRVTSVSKEIYEDIGNVLTMLSDAPISFAVFLLLHWIGHVGFRILTRRHFKVHV